MRELSAWAPLWMVSALGCFGAPGCTSAAARMTVDVMWAASPVMQHEDDPVLAEAAVLANLKTFDGLASLLPDNETLLRMAAEAYSSYAFAFLEPRTWAFANPDDPALLQVMARMKSYHMRAVGYAKRLLAEADEDVHAAIDAPLDELKRVLAEVDDEDTLEALYWVGQTWAMLVQSDTDDLENVAMLENIRVIMQRVAVRMPRYELGMPDIFLGSSQAAMGAGLSGDLTQAKEQLERGIAVSEGRFLLGRFLYARFYCTAVLDRKCFDAAISEILDADPAALMARRLTNTLVQRWARYWKANADQLF